MAELSNAGEVIELNQSPTPIFVDSVDIFDLTLRSYERHTASNFVQVKSQKYFGTKGRAGRMLENLK